MTAITWVSAANGREAEVPTLPFFCDSLFAEEQSDVGGHRFLSVLNLHPLSTTQAIVEHTLGQAQPEDYRKFERHGLLVAKQGDQQPDGKRVFNRI